MVRSSSSLAILLSLSHAMAAATAYMAMMHPAARLAVFALILLSLSYYLARDVLLLFPGSWCEISFEQGRVSVVTRDGSGLSGQVDGKTVVSPYFTVLRIRPDGHRLPVFRAIFPDALDTGEFRKLCTYLRFIQ